MPLDQMPHLKASLGKAKADRIRYLQRGTYRRQPGAHNLDNTIIEALQGMTYAALPGVLTDILTGIAYLDEPGSTQQLSAQRLFNIFQCMPVVNTREIQLMTALGTRQARRYMRAAKIALPFLERVLLYKDISNASLQAPQEAQPAET